MNQAYQLSREKVALIDLDIEGRFYVGGEDAEEALQKLFSLDLEILHPWKGCTGLFLDASAKIIAVATVFKMDEGFYVFTDASSAGALHSHLKAGFASFDVSLDDLREGFAWLCVLGPRAQDVMAKCGGEEILGLPYLRVEDNAVLDVKLFRMGYCGEFEYRLLVPSSRSEEISSKIMEAGREFGIGKISPDILPILMLEMRSITKADVPSDADPIQAGLHWMISFNKPGLVAKDVIDIAKCSPSRRSLMVLIDQPNCAADGDPLVIEGKEVGFLARVLHSPTLESDIGLAFADPEFGWVGVAFDVKGKQGTTTALGVSAPLFVTKTIAA